MDEEALIEKAEAYLKEMYDEDTVSMTVTKNKVNEEGFGILSVECVVSVDGEESAWVKDFYFENEEIVDMDYEER
ncbi:MAG: hypothetical protein A2452_02910 [Candidatus Firestonebacteria bacterium RIFOXYC2_FULL_39_67]|nr:MAG: hypothetical protein A2536_02325 [Candidatus Firestonebacteria bacterium RIFOXYD2_FULL_39_29]OGF55406.1 MAG: hypothetical protein A2452_02910 [Candidatus Firestonebacteria bacterium RIFOXYC2_FULL_39_67]OGF57951.1 MAG: hypothetical protein A2497_06735 [Candidatus Firestonebacteria bacterium RifOxyC12_full_39_7]